MKIKTLKTIKHKGHNIYIRQFSDIFEFIISFDNEIFTHHFRIKRKWYKKYTKTQFENCIKVAIGSAKDTVDELIRIKAEKNKPRHILKLNPAKSTK